MPDLIAPKRHSLLREPERLGEVPPLGEEVGGELVPYLRRAGTVLEAPPERGLRSRRLAVAGVADPEVRVRLPPLRRLGYDLLVGLDSLVVAAEHVQCVGPEGARSALLLLYQGCLNGLLEEVERLGVVGGVEGGEAGVNEHVCVLRVARRPALEGSFGKGGSAMAP